MDVLWMCYDWLTCDCGLNVFVKCDGGCECEYLIDVNDL
jgi:hypothetical protein